MLYLTDISKYKYYHLTSETFTLQIINASAIVLNNLYKNFIFKHFLST